MASTLGSALSDLRDAIATLGERVGLAEVPTLRLGITGLSRAGKTVFITALVHALTEGGALPAFRAHSSGRIARARIAAQPDAGVPRFQIEDHLRAILDRREWPDSTRAIAETRVLIDYERASGGRRKLALDIVDYPGEWLLDLALLDKDFSAFSREAVKLASLPSRAPLAAEWLEMSRDLDPFAPLDEARAEGLHRAFVGYLRACRDEERALSTLPPGRFLMPGDLEGSPALTFAPLVESVADPPRGSMGRAMADRFEAYKDVVVRPFFRDHFARLDRQVMLVDVLQALNAGPEAVADLRRALGGILAGFRVGRPGPIARLFARRIDRIVLAATKADHLHREDHERLQAIVATVVDELASRAASSGAELRTEALAAVRATREARSGDGEDALPLIVGTPIAGETIEGRRFDGETETAIFPGDLPRDPHVALNADQTGAIRFVRFRPPKVGRDSTGAQRLPHIRLDRTLEHLLGDRLL